MIAYYQRIGEETAGTCRVTGWNAGQRTSGRQRPRLKSNHQTSEDVSHSCSHVLAKVKVGLLQILQKHEHYSTKVASGPLRKHYWDSDNMFSLRVFSRPVLHDKGSSC